MRAGGCRCGDAGAVRPNSRSAVRAGRGTPALSGSAYRNVVVGSGVAGLASTLLALREGRVLLIARAGFARHVPARVDSVPAATIADLIEIGVDPRVFSDLRRHGSKLVAWAGGPPMQLPSPETVHIERGALEAALFAQVLRHPRLTLAPAPRGRAALDSMLRSHVRRGAVVLDATGRAAVLATRRVSMRSPWYAWIRRYPAVADDPCTGAFMVAATREGYCYRLGTRSHLCIGIVAFGRGPRHADILDDYRGKFRWLFDGVPVGEPAAADRVYPAAVQWAEHDRAVAVGDACLARDALSSQGLACALSDAHYAVAVESAADAALFRDRAAEQRRRHLTSLGGLLSESQYSGEASWQRYRAFLAQELAALDGPGEPLVVLRDGQLRRAAASASA